jgi:hypothetical protein
VVVQVVVVLTVLLFPLFRRIIAVVEVEEAEVLVSRVIMDPPVIQEAMVM